MDSRQTETLAVVIPGMRFGPHVPLLAYASRIATTRGLRSVPMSWRPPAEKTSAELGPWVVEQVTSALDKLSGAQGGSASLLIGKSLASHAAPVAAERQLPAVWLTPLLTQAPVAAALARATAPVLLVGGTADTLWDGKVARSLTEHVVEIEQADHSLWVPGPAAGSAAVLGRVADAIEQFLDQVLGLSAQTPTD